MSATLANFAAFPRHATVTVNREYIVGATFSWEGAGRQPTLVLDTTSRPVGDAVLFPRDLLQCDIPVEPEEVVLKQKRSGRPIPAEDLMWLGPA